MRKILIIEDDVFLAKMYSIKLKEVGIDSRVLTSGVNALNEAIEYQPGTIILDIIMPKKNGYDVMKELQSDDRTKNIPVIVLSKLSGDEDITKSKKMGSREFANKMDVSFSEVIEMVKKYLQ